MQTYFSFSIKGLSFLSVKNLNAKVIHFFYSHQIVSNIFKIITKTIILPVFCHLFFSKSDFS